LAARTCGKSTTDRLPAFFEAENVLVGARPNTHQEDSSVGQMEAFCKRLGDEGSLVVAPLPFPLAVEGHRHDDIPYEVA